MPLALFAQAHIQVPPVSGQCQNGAISEKAVSNGIATNAGSAIAQETAKKRQWGLAG
jgi:hypothetical protein